MKVSNFQEGKFLKNDSSPTQNSYFSFEIDGVENRCLLNSLSYESDGLSVIEPFEFFSPMSSPTSKRINQHTNSVIEEESFYESEGSNNDESNESKENKNNKKNKYGKERNDLNGSDCIIIEIDNNNGNNNNDNDDNDDDGINNDNNNNDVNSYNFDEEAQKDNYKRFNYLNTV